MLSVTPTMGLRPCGAALAFRRAEGKERAVQSPPRGSGWNVRDGPGCLGTQGQSPCSKSAHRGAGL